MGENESQWPRGIRNNNPGNIARGRDRWDGELYLGELIDAQYLVFQSPEWGIRAIARLLRTYWDRYHLRTVGALCERWAPPWQNPTDAFVAHVALAAGVDPDEGIHLAARLPDLIRGIIEFENGVCPYSSALIRRGIEWEEFGGPAWGRSPDGS